MDNNLKNFSDRNILDFYCHYCRLPPLWQVIYHEGMRQNHIIFEATDIDHFKNLDLKTSHSHFLDVDHSKLEEIGLSLLSTQSLAEIKNRIRCQPLSIRIQIYCLYVRLLDYWRTFFTYQLN